MLTCTCSSHLIITKNQFLIYGVGDVPQRREAVVVVINEESAHWQSCITRYSCGRERQSKPVALLLLLLAYNAGGGALGFHESSDVVEV